MLRKGEHYERVETILAMLAAGDTPADVVALLPWLSPLDVDRIVAMDSAMAPRASAAVGEAIAAAA